jgi:acyl-CoA thioesterase FadM
MSEFPWTTHEHVRISDCDPMGHANNAVYSTYLEQARIFELEHEIWAGSRLAAEAKSVLVGYDHESGASVPLSDDIKRRLST